MNKPTLGHQGDVFVMPYTGDISKLKKYSGDQLKPDCLEVALGETTGHKHAIYDLDKIDIFVAENGNLVVKTKQDVQLKHGFQGGTQPDHSTMTLTSGYYYEMRRQQENTLKGWRQSAD